MLLFAENMWTIKTQNWVWVICSFKWHVFQQIIFLNISPDFPVSLPQIQMTQPLKQSYSEKLNQLESQYGRLLVKELCLRSAVKPHIQSELRLSFVFSCVFRDAPVRGRNSWTVCMILCPVPLRSWSGSMRRRKRKWLSTGVSETVTFQGREIIMQ